MIKQAEIYIAFTRGYGKIRASKSEMMEKLTDIHTYIEIS
jgi:hypothetical protein